MIYVLLTLCAELLLAYVIVAIVLAHGLWRFIHRSADDVHVHECWCVYLWVIVWPIPVVYRWLKRR